MFYSKTKKNNNNQPNIYNPLINNKAQAVIEYVLILVVAVVIIGGLLFKLNKNLRSWGKNILGPDEGYVACLMQTGLLPGQTSSAGCSSNGFSGSGSGFDSSSGSGGGGSGSGGGGSGCGGGSGSGGGGSGSDSDSEGNSGSNSSSGSDSKSGSKPKSRTRSKNKSKKSARGSLISSQSRSNYSDINDENNISSNQKKKNKSSSSNRQKKNREFKNNTSSTDSDSGYFGRRFRAINSSGIFIEEEKKRKRKIPVSISNTAKKNSFTQKKKNLYLVQKMKKTQDKEAKIGAWTFGKIFRIILILGIIITVIYIIGNQAMTAKESNK